MKKMIISTLVMTALALCACEQKTIIPLNKLPQTGQTFLQTHFPNVNATMVIKEREGVTRTYEVHLANGFEVEFTRSGEWDHVDGNNQPVPTSILQLLPGGILTYVETAAPNLYITEVNKERKNYEIGLSNDVDLRFNNQGECIGMDD
jgi:hypothetical protein